jgi:hypothetical protein
MRAIGIRRLCAGLACALTVLLLPSPASGQG